MVAKTITSLAALQELALTSAGPQHVLVASIGLLRHAPAVQHLLNRMTEHRGWMVEVPSRTRKLSRLYAIVTTVVDGVLPYYLQHPLDAAAAQELRRCARILYGLRTILAGDALFATLQVGALLRQVAAATSPASAALRATPLRDAIRLLQATVIDLRPVSDNSI